MLTEIERERLKDRDSAKWEYIKRNDFLVRRKIKNWFNKIEDVSLVLKFLPDNQLDRLITHDQIYKLLDLITAMLHVVHVPQIINGQFVPTGELVTSDSVINRPSRPALRPGFKEILRPASAEEIEVVKNVTDRVKLLMDSLGDEAVADLIEDALSIRPTIQLVPPKEKTRKRS